MKSIATSLIVWTICGNVIVGIVLAGTVMGQGADDRRTVPEPIAIWASSPLEMIIAFPRAVSARLADSLVGRTIPYFQAQASAPPVGSIRIAGARLIDDGRTMILATDPHSSLAAYRLDVAPAGKTATTRQYSLTGVEAAWYPAGENGDPEPAWKGWWPDVDVEETRRLTGGSAPHERGLALLDKPGRLVISTLVKLPAGKITVRLGASAAIADATLGDEPSRDQAGPNPDPPQAGHAIFSVQSQENPLYLTFAVETGRASRPLAINAAYESNAEDSRKKLERERLFVPWAPFTTAPPAAQVSQETPSLAGGDARRGEALFFGEQARCSQCHAIGGRGGKLGPDLTEIGRKGRDQVYSSIAAPSAEIAPDYMTYTVAAKDGRVMAGVVRAVGAERIEVIDTSAKTTTIARAEIDQIRPSGNSIMPVGLAAALGPSNLRDLITFLCRPSTVEGSRGKK